MNKQQLIDQATRAWFAVMAASFAGHEVNAESPFVIEYRQASDLLESKFGMNRTEIARAYRDARKVSFYGEFAREVLGIEAISTSEVAA